MNCAALNPPAFCDSRSIPNHLDSFGFPYKLDLVIRYGANGVDMIKVVIFHNVARECRACRRPVTEVSPAGPVVVRTKTRGENPASCQDSSSGKHDLASVNFGGYRVGHPLVRVFELDFPLETPGHDGTPELVAHAVYQTFNAPEELLDIQARSLAAMYRGRQLRSLSVGDVVQVGDVLLACQPVGWSRLLNEVSEDHQGTHPWIGAL